MADHRPGAGGMARPLDHFPQFPAAARIVGVGRFRADADHHRPARHGDHVRRRERLAVVPFRLGLAVRALVLKVHRPRRLPHGLAGVLVEADDVLLIAAVEVHQQQVLEDDRRRAGAAIVVALEIAPFPQHLAGTGVDRRRARRSERDVDAPRLHRRRRRRVGVERVRVLRRRDLEQLDVAQDLPALLVERQDRQLAAILGRRRQPDLVVEDDGRRPGAAVNRRLPAHVLRFRPRQRQALRRRRAKAVGAAELRPLRRRTGDADDDEHREEADARDAA